MTTGTQILHVFLGLFIAALGGISLRIEQTDRGTRAASWILIFCGLLISGLFVWTLVGPKNISVP